MPSSMTHTYFCLDVYKCLTKPCQNKICDNLEYLKLFSQGPDPFMFYHFLIGKKAKAIQHIQSKMHNYDTKKFFLTTINYINNNNLTNNQEVMSYLYGFICHYYLDLYTHPLIYYKSGIFNKKDKTTYQYNGLHQAIEYSIDLYFINKRENIDPKTFKIHKEIFNINKLTNTIKNVIKVTIEDIYSIPKASYYYEKSIWYMKNFFKYLNYDPYGVKLKIYTLIDKITPKSIINLKELSFSNTYPNINNYLNLENNIWYCPWDKTKSYKYSFLDLYEIAKKESIKTIEEISNMLEKKKIDNKKLNILFKDLSYCTGIPCHKKVKMKYFEVGGNL